MYRIDYYWWMVVFGIDPESCWLHTSDFQGIYDLLVNWLFFLPNLIAVEIIFRWGENTALPSKWQRVLNVFYYVITLMTIIFTIHALVQLRIPSILGTYESGWIL